MKKIVSIIAIALLIVSCNKPARELVGMGVKGGIFKESNPYGMVYIPAGTFTMGINDEAMFKTQNQRPVKVTLDAFWMDATEITNDEYKQFLNYVKDSIAYRKLIMAGIDKYIKPVKGEEDEPTPEKALINWKKRLPWKSKDEEIQDILKDLYFQGGNVLNGKKEINPSKLLYYYEWYDYSQAELPQNQYDIRTGKFPENAMVVKDSAYIDEDGKIHNVTVKRKLTSRNDFYCSKIINIYPDTTAWMRDFQYAYNDPKLKTYFSHPAFAQYPVVGITWEQAEAFCHWRTKLYYGTSYSNGEEFRLPSKAEWEYAARGGKELGLYPWGGNYTRDKKGCYLANFKPAPAGYGDDTGKTTMKVGSFAPNNYGLYDMAGNVAEWTSTAYKSVAKGTPVLSELNPKFQYNAKADDGDEKKLKIVKGGSWKDVAYYLQCGVDTHLKQDESRPYIGFRCVRTYVGE